MRRFPVYLLLQAGLLFLLSGISSGQVENVPVGHPVYDLLKRLEVKGVISQYHDAVLPLSRREVGAFLQTADAARGSLTATESRQLDDFRSEFSFEITGSFDGISSLLTPDDDGKDDPEFVLFSDREKHLYGAADSTLSVFVDGLVKLDLRRSAGDALDGKDAAYVEFGGRIRGTVGHSLGYYLQATNAQFWGERDVLFRDRHIRQAYTLGILNAQNFDFVEGYVRYDAGIVSAQLGRERLLWGNGYGDRMILSDNVRVFDFVRADAQYGWFKYTFLHGWLLGKKTELAYTLPSDSTAVFTEPVVADKYVAAHRIECSIPRIADIGFQEMAIYSNRSVDLAYLNPLTLIESAQRSREERDNVLWAFDVQLHLLRNIELHGDIVFDDLNFPKWGTETWENRYAYQAGILLVDPLIDDLTLVAEYTRVQPFTFSHGRSRDNDYGSFGSILSHHIGPNADSWIVRGDYAVTYRFHCIAGVEVTRRGENVLDANGTLLLNAGGDYLQPHRTTDPVAAPFLAGTVVRTRRMFVSGSWEIVNQFYLEGWYQQIRVERPAVVTLDHDFGVAIRVDY